MRQFDTIILGNGVLSLFAAWELMKIAPNMQLAIVGPSSREGSATLAAGAMLGVFSEITVKTLASQYGRAVLDMGIKAAKIWPDLLSELNQYLPEQSKITPQPGTFVVLNTESSKYEGDNFDAILAALKQRDESFQEVNPGDIPGLEPEDRCRPLKSIFLPNENAINPDKLLNALSIVLKQKNVTFIDESVIDFSCSTSTEKINSIITSNGNSITADKVLLAAGAYSQALLDKLPYLAERIPRIFAGLGCSAILRNTEDKIPFKTVIRSPNRANACGVHILPCDEQADYLYFGASNTCIPFPQTEPRIRDVYYLLKRAMEQINHNLHNKKMVKYQVGNRPVTMDTFPLVGSTSIDNLWVVTGTYRIGIQLAPLLAKFVANNMLYLDDKVDSNMHLFSPERKLIEAFTQKEAIDIFVKERFGAGYEHAMVLPKMGWESMMVKAMYEEARGIYSQLETDISIYPDILSMLEQNKKLIPIFKNYLKKHEATCIA